jgi:hypothetical protein
MMTIQDVQSPWTFDREWEEILEMRHESVKRRDQWQKTIISLTRENGRKATGQSDFKEAVRNYNALRGVVKALDWVLNTQANPPLD